ADSKDLIVFEQEQFSQAGDERNVNDKLIQLIDEALEHGERFLPLYQPMVSLHGNSREDYVVYLRLRDDENNLLMPDEFMPSAARADRMAEIDRWIIRRAIQEVAERRKQGERLNFLINLSAEGIADDSLLLWVCDCLREFKAKGAWLTFIVSQQDVMRNLEQMEQLSEGLRQINCRIALSHFSFEQEAVNLVKHLSPNMVCFETDTAANIARNKEHRAMLSDYNEQLQKEGVKTVVTNIEEAAQLTLLWNIGVNYIQGNFIQEPVESIVYDAEL
ncbi:MAG TPA: EAL domain-containing protein, partial [Chromatiaceae bacterium]|nr:EAL domain-containing protein [Chromatiaceae bacterium]